MTPVRVLALSPVPEQGAGFRFRVAQFIPGLEACGFQVTGSPFFTNEYFRVVYRKGQHARKLRLFLQQTVRRLREVATASRYDLFFIYREAFPIGPPLIELALSRFPGRALVYDYDDAIFLPNASEANEVVSSLKYYRKVDRIIRKSDCVIAGNQYLADHARAHNAAVTIIPTSVDTTKFIPGPSASDARHQPIVGWIGTHSTLKYLRSLIPTMERVAACHPFVLNVVTDAAPPLIVRGVEVRQRPWSLEREVLEFQGCDVGVYPLWDDPWAQGKCGFKAIQFMACGVPVVAAAVGVNREIIQDGVNGFLAATDEEWVEKLGYLLSDARLRERLGNAGRVTVEERYSVHTNGPKIASTLHDAMARAQHG